MNTWCRDLLFIIGKQMSTGVNRYTIFNRYNSTKEQDVINGV